MTEVIFGIKAVGKDLNYQWIKDNEPLVDSEKYKGGVNGTLLAMKDVDKSDEGFYRYEIWSGKREWTKVVSNSANLSLGKHMQLCELIYYV